MPVRIFDDLASMLESHPMLPFQGAGGMTALTAQVFLDQGYEDYYGKESPKAKGSGKGKRVDYSKPKQDKDKGQAKGQWKERDHDQRTN